MIISNLKTNTTGLKEGQLYYYTVNKEFYLLVCVEDDKYQLVNLNGTDYYYGKPGSLSHIQKIIEDSARVLFLVRNSKIIVEGEL